MWPFWKSTVCLSQPHPGRLTYFPWLFSLVCKCQGRPSPRPRGNQNRGSSLSVWTGGKLSNIHKTQVYLQDIIPHAKGTHRLSLSQHSCTNLPCTFKWKHPRGGNDSRSFNSWDYKTAPLMLIRCVSLNRRDWGELLALLRQLFLFLGLRFCSVSSQYKFRLTSGGLRER